MKNIILLVIIIGAAFIAFNYFQSSGGAMPEDEKEIARVEENFDGLAKNFKQAIKSTAVGGLDTTSELDAMLIELERIEKEVKSLEQTAESQTAKDRLNGLKKKITGFKNKNGI